MKKDSYAARLWQNVKRHKGLYLMILPIVAYYLVFCYYPMYGAQIAFRDYTPKLGVLHSPWAGLKHFAEFFKSVYFERLIRNTLSINLKNLLFGFPAPILLALLLNEVRSQGYKKFVQTVSYMPHFISWVVFGGIVITLLSGDGGLFNQILLKLGVIEQPIVFMADSKYFWAIAILSNLVKELGWSTILYTAAISGVDQELYEAADLDGASRVQKMRYVTLPCIKGTIVIMVIFAVAGIMNNNFDQLYVLQNSFNLEKSEVIDTYIYKVGLQQLQFGMAAAVNIFKSILAIILLTTANFVSNKLTDRGLF